MFPNKVSLRPSVQFPGDHPFKVIWREVMNEGCHRHPVWETDFARTLLEKRDSPTRIFQLAATWSINMVAGSYCFPRYVAALAARAEEDCVRYGLLENAWDEAGSYGHEARSHFWLAVKLARLLGLADEEIERIKPIPEAMFYTDEHYLRCSDGEFLFALGMICLLEEFTTPEFSMIFEAFMFSCEDGYGKSPDAFVLEGGAEYFTANIADDERHKEEMPRMVATRLTEMGVNIAKARDVKKALQPVREGIRYSADIRARFFDGIYFFVENGGVYTDLH